MVRNPSGILITTPDDGARESQVDTVQCVHCGRHHVYEAAVLAAIKGGLGFCAKCNGITCGEMCQECVPAEQQLENMEKFPELAGVPEFVRKHRPIFVGGLPGVTWRDD